MTTDETKSTYIDFMVKSLHAGETNHQLKTDFETNNNNIRTPCSNNVNTSELRMTPCSTNGELRLSACSNNSELRLATACSNNGELRLAPGGNNVELRLAPCSNASELRLTGCTNNAELKLAACSNTNGDLRLPSEFSIEYWNSPSGLGLSIEKDDASLWETSLLDEMNFFNAKMTTQDLEQHPESSTGEPCETTDSNHIIYTTLTSLSNDPSSPSISLDDTSAHSTSTPSWYHPPSTVQSSGVDNSPTISTTSISSTSTAAQNKVPNIEDLDSFLNIIPADAGQSYGTGYSESTTFEWKQDTGDPGGNLCEATANLCEASNLWKTPSSEDNDSLLRNALEGKSAFKYANANNNNNNEFVLTIKEENAGLSNLVLDNQNISTIIYPIDSNSGQSIDEILQNINTHYETSVDEFNNNNTGEYSKVNGGESIEIYYAIDNNINVNYVPSNNTISSSVPGSTAKKKKTKTKVLNHNSSSSNNNNNNELINGKKERSLHYCEICNKGFKDKYSVNVHVRTHTGEKPFPCKICCKTFRQKAHLAKHFQTHLAPATHTTKSSGVSSSNKVKIMKT